VATAQQIQSTTTRSPRVSGQAASAHSRNGGSRRNGEMVSMGTVSLCCSAVGMGALIVVVQARASDVDGLPSTLVMLLLAMSVAGLVFGALTGIVSLARPTGPGGRPSGVAAAGLLLSVWLMALGLELVALLSTTGSSDALDQADPGAPRVIVMAAIVVLAAAGITVAVIHRARAGPKRGR